jgi:multidrug efflux system membrane fusion protein
MTRASSRRRLLWLIALLALLLAGGGAWLRHRSMAAEKPAATAPPPVVATTVRVQQRDMPIMLTGVGTVSALQSVTVRARIDGQLDKVGFVEGQDVKEGQLLAQIDPRTLQAQLAQIMAQKAKDQAQLQNARRDLQRYTDLIRQDAATQQTLDTARAQVAQLEAALQSDDAQINFARVQLSYTRITAPIGGRVGARLVDPGNIVHAADANGLVVINQIDPIAVVFTLPEDAFQNINRALRASPQALPVLAYARNGDEMLGQGSLILLNNQIDTSSGTVQLKARFPNAEHKLWPGQYVNARLVLGQRRQALTVPAGVVQRGPNGVYAYVVDADSTARMQPIQVADIQDGVAVIEHGLSAGQRVVLDGQYKLKAGLRVAEASAQNGSASAAQPPPAPGSAK